MKKFLNKILTRKVITGALIFFQIVWWVLLLFRVSGFFPHINTICNMIGIILAIYIINRDNNPSYKLAWILPIMIFPLFGTLIYLLYSNKRPSRYLRKKFNESKNALDDTVGKSELYQDENVISKMDGYNTSISRYLNRVGYPVYDETQTEYFKSGEELFPHILEEISKAERFIFVEYFIIQEGKVWNSILDILAKKAKEGVDVRVIYDDVGSVSKIPTGYNKKLESMGIKTAVFNPFIPFISVVMNNRDHRKILVVDGNTAFTGGINLADEYMNITHPFGYWKDTAVMMRGKAVWSFTYMFLHMWNAINDTSNADTDFNKYRPETFDTPKFNVGGFVQPFCDSPLDDESVSQNVYINMLHSAKKYAYICTPYLVIDDEMKNALTFAAKRGVDVRIITPGIPDKKFVYRLTRSYYPGLLASGVKIYEYSPGFVHAKSFVCDDETAMVGTINLDFRSLYLHFECGVLLTGTNTVFSIRDDMEYMFNICEEIKEPKKRSFIGKVFDSILRTFAPLV